MQTDDSPFPRPRLNCGDYETLELVCIKRYRVELRTHAGENVSGRAVDLQTRAGYEMLVLEQHDGSELKVEANTIRRLDVLDRPSYFQTYVFGSAG